MSEQLLKEILEGQKQLAERLDRIETKIDTGLKNTTEANNALLGLIEKTYRKTEQIETKLDHHANMLDVLAARTTHQEAEIKGLKVAR
ncbi:hypothetical protein M7775_02340 [Sporomusa sphaeroides DSM 2875]|uniref:hypothetical protein n=1 Tax=Sporomusa sphaeroides TaxID=47679 RepID=UPI00202F5D35|nr:hypothetical protein [Sporomusa sphaeroides]MCM0757405.1 hypothetical protein [Sporomusa sphaeroides DSM 2875]